MKVYTLTESGQDYQRVIAVFDSLENAEASRHGITYGTEIQEFDVLTEVRKQTYLATIEKYQILSIEKCHVWVDAGDNPVIDGSGCVMVTADNFTDAVKQVEQFLTTKEENKQ